MKSQLFRYYHLLIELLFWVLVLNTLPLNSLMAHTLAMDEVCDNAIDDDGDGLIDLNDPDCECEVVEPISYIPNPSFEDMDCCPWDISQLDCASVWIQASEPTTDYIHTCGFMGWPEFPPPQPFPDGDGIMGFRDGRVDQNGMGRPYWKEYAGACLTNPLEADSTYRLQFHVGFVDKDKSPNINITFFGTPDCENLPFGVGDQDLGCPTNDFGWSRLAAKWVKGEGEHKWVKTFIEITPSEDIAAIAIGPDCPPVPTTQNLYYFFDNLLLADFKLFELLIEEVSLPCKNDFSLTVPDNPEFNYQWFKDGIALLGETGSTLTTMYGEGDYQVRIQDDQSCRISALYPFSIPYINKSIDRTICKDGAYLFGDHSYTDPGIYIDTVQSDNACDTIVTLDLSVQGVERDTIKVTIFDGEKYQVGTQWYRKEGDHLISLESHLGCDSLLLLQLSYYHVFIPNVFTPNGDGINDVLKVESQVGQLISAELLVFDRWGSLVYQGEQWNGEIRGKVAEPGVFAVLAKLTMNDGKEREFVSSVTLLR